LSIEGKEIDQEYPKEEEEVKNTQIQGNSLVAHNVSPLISSDEVYIIGENPYWEE
jgi:hypothetical protein